MNLGSLLFGENKPKTEKSPVKVFSKEDIDLFNLLKSNKWLMFNMNTQASKNKIQEIKEEMSLRGLSDEDYDYWLNNHQTETIH